MVSLSSALLRQKSLTALDGMDGFGEFATKMAKTKAGWCVHEVTCHLRWARD